MRTRSLLLTVLLGLSLSLVGCSSKKAAEDTTGDSVVSDSAADMPLELNGSSDEGTAGGLQTVYFDFDSSRLSESARMTLEQNAQWLKLSDRVDIQIEGHADERGGIQYNLALGERRARSVKDYLVALGVDANRITIVSYGKEKPIAFGHSEADWSRNRRANFVITAK